MTCEHQWILIGENTGGFVYWCEECGALIDDDGTNYREAKRAANVSVNQEIH